VIAPSMERCMTLGMSTGMNMAFMLGHDPHQFK